MNKKVVKELFIIVLLFMVIMFTLGILFYDCISANNEQIESISYVTDESVTNTLKEIEEKSGTNIEDGTSNSLLKSYSINANDLTTYAAEKYYESGKKDPFAESADPIEDVITKTTTGAEKNTSQTSNPIEIESNNSNKSQTNTVKSDSTKNTTLVNTAIQNKTSNNTNSAVQNKTTNNINSNNTISANNTVLNTVKNNESSKGTFFEKTNSK